jgi:hypothetical protein
MRIEKGLMIPLGYGKYFRSESIAGIEPIEENRGPRMRTRVYVEGCSEPVVASRSDGAILRDLIGSPHETMKSQEQQQLLADILDTLATINPMLRSIIHDQGHWDLDRLEERIKDVLENVPELAGRNE